MITIVAARVPDKAAKPELDHNNGVGWGPTQDSVRIEFEANDHDHSDLIYNYGVEISRWTGSAWTDWGWWENVNHREGTISALLRNPAAQHAVPGCGSSPGRGCTPMSAPTTARRRTCW